MESCDFLDNRLLLLGDATNCVSAVTIDDRGFYVLLHKLCMINYVIEEQKKLYF